MGIHERLVPCVTRARALNGDDLFRSRALLNIAADCGKCFPSLAFQLFLNFVVRSYIVSELPSFVIAQLRVDVNELLASIFYPLIWKDHRSSINYEHGTFGLALAGRCIASDRWTGLRSCCYSPHYLMVASQP